MVLYRRNYIKGGYYFFTVTLRDRQSRLLIEHIDILRQAMQTVRKKYPFQIDAIVILPDHIHAIWRLPEDDDSYSTRWKNIKGLFTKGIIAKGLTFKKNKSGEYNIWQHRFWEHTIRNEIDYQKHCDYIHYNPVKHRLVKYAIEWPYSSFIVM